MAGAVPNTGWLDGCIALDEKGFVKTGPDLSSDDLAKAKWPLARPPYLLETSRPRIFAVGDVRCGNVKRWSHRRLAKDRSRSRSSIKCCVSDTRMNTRLLMILSRDRRDAAEHRRGAAWDSPDGASDQAASSRIRGFADRCCLVEAETGCSYERTEFSSWTFAPRSGPTTARSSR